MDLEKVVKVKFVAQIMPEYQNCRDQNTLTQVLPRSKNDPVRTQCWLAKAAEFLAVPIELISVPIDWKMFGDVPSEREFFDPGFPYPLWPAKLEYGHFWVVFGFFDK